MQIRIVVIYIKINIFKLNFLNIYQILLGEEPDLNKRHWQLHQ